jgi:hypothetical protein
MQDVALDTKFLAVFEVLTAFKNKVQYKKNILMNYFKI